MAEERMRQGYDMGIAKIVKDVRKFLDGWGQEPEGELRRGGCL